MTIGTLAQRAQVPISTLRFYERRGLIRPASRSAAGYRHYCDADVRRVRFIRRAAQLGFTLEELHELLNISNDGKLSQEELVAYGECKVEEISKKIEDLERVRRGLKQLLARGQQSSPEQICPVVSSLG